MPTHHETALEHVVAERLKDPVWRNIIVDTCLNLRNNKYPQDWVDAIFQNMNTGLSLTDAYVFAQIWTMLQNGDIVTAEIIVDSFPEREANMQKNEETLNDLPSPFISQICSGAGEPEDGIIEWTHHILMRQHNTDRAIKIDKWSSPLEIGFTNASRTLLHLVSECTIARWSYESSSIKLLTLVNSTPFGKSLGRLVLDI